MVWTLIDKPTTAWTGVFSPTSRGWNTVWMPPMVGRNIFYILRNFMVGYDGGIPQGILPWTLVGKPSTTWTKVDKPT